MGFFRVLVQVLNFFGHSRSSVSGLFCELRSTATSENSRRTRGLSLTEFESPVMWKFMISEGF
jgi:hypothetical protein